MKTVVFNVGGALSCYIEGYENSIVVDLGKSDNFSPVNDFLLPLYRKRNSKKSSDGRYIISQLIISHPHKDHLSDIQDFNKYFNPYLLTAQNNKSSVTEENINWDIIDTPDDSDVKCLKDMMASRSLPLKGCSDFVTISYLLPGYVENNSGLKSESYTNNVSIATYVKMGGYGVFLPGDLQKNAMAVLLDKANSDNAKHSKKLINKLKYDGVDFLICPHHGLRSSFSTELFETMKGGKTEKLNIVSEKSSCGNDNRNVDTRYSSSDYCSGNNNLGTAEKPAYQRKTSNGHIFIDDAGRVTITDDINEILDSF